MKTTNAINKINQEESKNKLKSKFKPNSILGFKQYFAIGTLTAVVFLVPELASADDAFQAILTKTTGWVNGSAGKLITFISLAMAGIMGVAGFPTKYVVGSLGTGLLLSSANGIVDMIF